MDKKSLVVFQDTKIRRLWHNNVSDFVRDRLMGQDLCLEDCMIALEKKLVRILKKLDKI